MKKYLLSSCLVALSVVLLLPNVATSHIKSNVNAEFLTSSKSDKNHSILVSQASNPLSKLLTGVYYYEGRMYDNSRREILNHGNRVCIKIVDGPVSRYSGKIDVIISTVSLRKDKLYIDAMNEQIYAYTQEEYRKKYAIRISGFEQIKSAFEHDNIGGLWVFGRYGDYSKTDRRSTPEQNKRMQECIKSQGKYVRKIPSLKIRGSLGEL